jgi:hypothetical protein
VCLFDKFSTATRSRLGSKLLVGARDFHAQILRLCITLWVCSSWASASRPVQSASNISVLPGSLVFYSSMGDFHTMPVMPGARHPGVLIATRRAWPGLCLCGFFRSMEASGEVDQQIR